MSGNSDSLLRQFWQAFGSEPTSSALGEFIRYAAVSAVAFLADFAVLVLLTEVAGIHYLASAATGFSVGILIAYVLSVRWVFAARRLSSASTESAVFLLIGIAGLVINHLMMFGLTEIALVPYAVSKIGAAGAVFTVNFSLRKFLLFTASADS